MLHLSALSEHAVGALTAAGAGRAARASRQVAPAYAAAESGLCAAGVSAFAFQGTNAHVQLTLPSQLLQNSGSRGGSAAAGEQGVGGAVVWSVSERLWVTHVASPLLRSFLCPDGARAQAAMEQLALPHFCQELSPQVPSVMFELRLGAPHLAPLAGLCVGGMSSDSGMQGFDASQSLHLVPPSLMLAMAAAAVRSADLRQPRCQSPVLLCDGEFAPQAPEPTSSYLAASILCVLSPAEGRVVVLAASDQVGADAEQSSEWEAAQAQQGGEDGKVWQGDGGFDDDVQGEGVDQEGWEEQQAWEAEQPDEGWEQEQAEAGVQLLMSASIVATLPVQHSTNAAVAAVESSLEGPAVARARQIVRSLMHELGAFGDLMTAPQQEAPMFATLGSPGSGGSCGMDEGVAEVCLEEARLQLRGAGLLSGFDSWVLGVVE